MTLGVRLFLILLFLATFVAHNGAQGKPEKDKLRIGYAARAVAHSVPYVAKEAGLFAEEGLDADVVRTAGNIAPMALVANEVDFAIMSALHKILTGDMIADMIPTFGSVNMIGGELDR